MKLRLGLDTLPAGISAAWSLFLLIAALFALVIFAVVIYTGKFTSGWQMGVAALQFFVLLPLPMIAGFNLAQSRRVLMSRAAPMAVWRKEVREVCGSLFVAWAVVSGCSVLLALLLHASATELEDTIANSGFSAVYMVLVTLIATPQLGLRNFVWLLGIAPLLLIFGLDVTGHTFSDLKSAPWSLLFVGLTLLSVTLIWLHNRTVRPLKVQTVQATQKSTLWKFKLDDWFRLPLIDPDQKPFLLLPILLASQFSLLYRTSFSMLNTLGDDVTPWNVIRVWVLITYAQVFLSSRDMHWRNLLAPGGVFRSRIGQRIVISTLGSVTLFVAAMMCVLLLMDRGLASVLPHPQINPKWDATLPIACEVVLAVSLATLIRGFSAARRMQIAVLFSLLLIAVAAILYATGLLAFNASMPSFGVVNSTYLLGLLALAAICTLAANRVWARADLAGLYRKRQTPDALPDGGW
jgi:hypothetical protein